MTYATRTRHRAPPPMRPPPVPALLRWCTMCDHLEVWTGDGWKPTATLTRDDVKTLPAPIHPEH